ncbi:hypothetical protein [Albimonas pacifica]|uniref:Helix-hairpin-helix DNA-binding protein n=1 Tax=Albimonas pacifica TaxID=1114924 RepID=A0A1I3IYE8_9RHOB|nr:hypothetical protein [Albimonas pacifica]SFI52868.1 Helix-hairpin-helix DNA-binding protein [Albimonas pacifica]
MSERGRPADAPPSGPRASPTPAPDPARRPAAGGTEPGGRASDVGSGEGAWRAPDGATDAGVAARLRDLAELLDRQGEGGFRARAFRAAAAEVEARLARGDPPLADLFRRGGPEALEDLPAIGRGIAAAVAEMLTTGRWRRLERLQGELTPEALFATLPGVGPQLAHRLADALEVDTLEELETALRLGETQVEGVGPRRRAAILAALGARLAPLRRTAGARAGHGPPAGLPLREPSAALLLEIDAEYRRRAAAGELPRIAPRRFNPTGEAWLPILHARRDGWEFTALHSNTARAHELGRTGDWVAIYFHEPDGPGGGPEGRRTVVTERRGDLAGRRVVRGREDDCRRLPAPPTPQDGPARDDG